jgi:hypothetical protein
VEKRPPDPHEGRMVKVAGVWEQREGAGGDAKMKNTDDDVLVRTDGFQ